MKNADMPAMPYVVPNNVTAQPYAGLTKREMMAMNFHAALLTAQADGVWMGIGVNAARHAVKEADLLIAELDRTSK